MRKVSSLSSRSNSGLSFRQNPNFRDGRAFIPVIPQRSETGRLWRMTCIGIPRNMRGDMQKQTSRKGTHLEEAVALLIQTQAAFVAQLAESSRESDRRFTEIKNHLERLGHIEAMLVRHERILTDLPEVIRQKIGFQPS